MLFRVICSCHNNLCRSIAMNSIMHLILYCCKKFFCNLTIERIINCRSIDICYFLIETALTRSDFLYFRNEMVKIIFIKNLTIDQSVFI